MSQALYLRSWDRADRRYRLDRRSRGLQRVPAASVNGAGTAGFVKRCLVGPPLVVFQLDGAWRIRTGKDELPLGDPALALRVRRWGPFTRATLATGGRRRHLLYAEAFRFFAARLDPTFDDLDASAADFSRWLLEKHRQARAAPAGGDDRRPAGVEPS